MATIALNIAKNQLIDYAKSQLFVQLKKKLEQGESDIDALFVVLKNNIASFTFLNKNVLNTILVPICSLNQEDLVKTELKAKIDKIDFSKELEKMKENMPEITKEMEEQIVALPETLKTKLKTLIEDIIICVPQSASTNSDSTNSASTVSASTNSTGGSNQRDRKQKRRRKTKKRINKRSRGRKRHSRK